MVASASATININRSSLATWKKYFLGTINWMEVLLNTVFIILSVKTRGFVVLFSSFVWFRYWCNKKVCRGKNHSQVFLCLTTLISNTLTTKEEGAAGKKREWFPTRLMRNKSSCIHDQQRVSSGCWLVLRFHFYLFIKLSWKQDK